MIKIINKGLNKEGVKQLNDLLESNRVKYPKEMGNWFLSEGMRVGKSSKTLMKFNPNTTMGFYGIQSVKHGWIQIPLSWLNYELKEV